MDNNNNVVTNVADSSVTINGNQPDSPPPEIQVAVQSQNDTTVSALTSLQPSPSMVTEKPAVVRVVVNYVYGSYLIAFSLVWPLVLCTVCFVLFSVYNWHETGTYMCTLV